MNKKRVSSEDIIIVELFLVKADWHRTFIGSIRREVGRKRNPILCGEVMVVEGMIWSMSSNQEELMNNMDDICLMKLDYNLHSCTRKSVFIAGTPFYLN
jgi:hypothetical protein